MDRDPRAPGSRDGAVGEPGPSRRDWWCITAFFSTLGLLLYGPALVSWYSSDDFLHYATAIQGGLPFVPDHPGGGFLRPLVGLSLWLDYRAWGLNPLPAHLFSIVLHSANSLLVTKLAMVIQQGRANRGHFGPIAAGLLFLVLGCHAEPVSWISSRGDVLATFFILLMLIQFCRALQYGGLRFWLASLACLALALLSKESAFAAPFVALMCLWLLQGADTRRSLGRIDLLALTAHGALFGAYFLFRKWMLGYFVGGYGARGHLRFHHDLVAQSLGHFAWRIFLPPLPAWALASLPTLEGLWALAFLAAVLVPLLALAWRGRRRLGLVLFCALSFLAALSPVFNVRIYLSEMEGERYLYLASVFAAMGAGFAIALIRGAGRRRGVLAVFAVFQALLLLAGVQRWNGAAAIARSIVTGIEEQHRGGPIVLANKPDAYGGALVFRTGLPEALRYFGPRPIDTPEVNVLFATGLFQWDHAFTFGPDPGGAPGAYALAAADPTSGFSEEDRDDLIETLEHSRNHAVFVFRKPLHDSKVFYYDSLGVKAAGPIGPAVLTPAIP